MNHKAQKILNYCNAKNNLIKRENKRINTLKNTNSSQTVLVNFVDNVKKELINGNDYDISNMNKQNIQISQKINMDFSKEQVDMKDVDIFDINDVYNKNIKCLYNIYQQKYRNDINVTGFGDFIRGCYFLLDFCDRFSIKLQVIINHDLNIFLKNRVQLSNNTSFSNIVFFVNNNWDSYYIDKNENIHSRPGKYITSSFIKYLKEDAFIINDSAFIYTIAYPINNISENHKKIMQKILEPNDEMKLYVYKTLENNEMIIKNYNVIHIRTGDSYLNDEKNKISFDQVKKIRDNIYSLIKSEKQNTKFIVISDNNYLKKIIKSIFTSFVILMNDITHFGEGQILKIDKIKNTMLDFYIMALSNKIFSFSIYEHGTGFSQWCAETYNIPYSCKLLNL